MSYQKLSFIKVKNFIQTACLSLVLAGFSTVLTGCDSSSNQKKIGIIVPIEHKAMNEIVAGFTETLRENYPVPVKIKVANAQGDINLERAMIQQMRNENYDLIVPIGTDASQMSAAVIKKQPILSLASSLTDKDRKQRKPCNLAVVQDEIPTQKFLSFIHAVYPDLSRLVLIHSTSEKVFPEVQAAIAAGKANGIQVKAMMVPTLNDLYSTANNIPADTQGIIVLKDHLIVSGISTLEITAARRKIPLMTSDQGSVQEGAGFALGVHEREIGVYGAKVAKAILSGVSACDIGIARLTSLTVFINKASLLKENQSLETIQKAAKKLNYAVEFVQSGKEE